MNNTNTPEIFSFTDLVAIKNIIDIASTRGAFRANELKEVGGVYDRLSAFLEQAQAKAAEEAAANQQNPEENNNVVS
jgi:ATP phosphoribosyltransferase